MMLAVRRRITMSMISDVSDPELPFDTSRDPYRCTCACKVAGYRYMCHISHPLLPPSPLARWLLAWALPQPPHVYYLRMGNQAKARPYVQARK